MPKRHVTLLGKAIKATMKLRGGGSALPGLVVEKLDRNFISDALAQLPDGVVVISGTNGKTTTTKMVVALLESQGKKVFTNRTGSNFTRGIAAALLGEIDNHGNLNADIAVLELDEAHAVHFVRNVKPRFSLLLNVMRDQLDRFGEIDATAQLLKAVADATTDKVVINREDPRLLRVATSLPTDRVSFFGLGRDLRATFPTDDDMRSAGPPRTKQVPSAISTLTKFDGTTAVFDLGSQKISTPLKLEGIYNVYNAAAALGLIAVIIPTLDAVSLRTALSNVTPAFGRGESIEVAGQTIDLVLVKNPAGFRLSLKSFPPDSYATMIAINDNYADGRDMSWLWDVDFDSLKTVGVQAVAGIRAYDMALRLQYDEVAVSHVTTDLKQGLKKFLSHDHSRPKRVYCTYTAMIVIRKELAKIAVVEKIS